MSNFAKQFASTIRFWCQEIKLRRTENAEWEQIEDEAFAGKTHPMAGLGYYMTMRHNRKERKRIHEEEITKIS
ncbi:MAG: hypothetical protein IJS13_09130 [Paludibacteraceae bacterium]|nr:hypothetical protein [Paludibacteraceae bacterium]